VVELPVEHDSDGESDGVVDDSDVASDCTKAEKEPVPFIIVTVTDGSIDAASIDILRLLLLAAPPTK